jgi:hypothetical protein
MPPQRSDHAASYFAMAGAQRRKPHSPIIAPELLDVLMSE